MRGDKEDDSVDEETMYENITKTKRILKFFGKN
jgi:hypothetical protein